MYSTPFPTHSKINTLWPSSVNKAEFRRRYGATYDMQEVWDSGHRSCDSKLIIQLYKIRKKNGTASTGNPE